MEQSFCIWTQETRKQAEEGSPPDQDAQTFLDDAKSWEMLLAEE